MRFFILSAFVNPASLKPRNILIQRFHVRSKSMYPYFVNKVNFRLPKSGLGRYATDAGSLPVHISKLRVSIILFLDNFRMKIVMQYNINGLISFLKKPIKLLKIGRTVRLPGETFAVFLLQ